LSNELKAGSRVPPTNPVSRPAVPPLGSSLSSPTDSQRDQLCLLVNSRNPIITVETGEEQRFIALLERVTERLGIPLYTWSVTTGLARNGGATLYNSDEPEQALANIGTVQGDGIFLLKDFARYGDSDRISRKLRDLADGFRTARRSIILLAAAINLPAELSADAGLSQRLLATLLTWMQDRQAGVFLAATSNSITVLPPEMPRKGRFDEIFFVDLPNTENRAALFALHLKKRGRDPGVFDSAKLAQASEGFSGAEIEQAIVSALYTAFSQKQQLSTEILLSEIRSTQPLSVTRAEEITAIREWAKNRAVPAD
jgi:ATPase family associated with various cellular activities (AAA)